MRKNIGFIMLIMLMILVVGCTFYSKEKTPTPLQKHVFSEKPFFKVTSLVDYNSSLCGSSSIYPIKQNGFNSGIRLVLKDKNTEELLEGDGTFSTSERYTCKGNIDTENVQVSAYAKGYTPLTFNFNFKYPKNQLATIEVYMMKSCSGGQSCSYGLDDEDPYNFYNRVEDQFGLEKSDYNFQCMECNMGRGGFIKAKGTYKDGSPLELYYHWGFCSSGGTDCGWSICFSSTSNDLFESIKDNFCNKLSSGQLHDEHFCKSKGYDETEEVRKKCATGEFEKKEGSRKTLSIIQSSSRCKNSVNVGEFNCLEN